MSVREKIAAKLRRSADRLAPRRELILAPLAEDALMTNVDILSNGTIQPRGESVIRSWKFSKVGLDGPIINIPQVDTTEQDAEVERVLELAAARRYYAAVRASRPSQSLLAALDQAEAELDDE